MFNDPSANTYSYSTYSVPSSNNYSSQSGFSTFTVNFDNNESPEEAPVEQGGSMFGAGFSFGVVPSYKPQVNPDSQAESMFGAGFAFGVVPGYTPHDHTSDTSASMFGGQPEAQEEEQQPPQQVEENPYQELLRKLEASGQKHTDSEFPPELKTLTGGLTEHELRAQGCAVNFKSLVWLRPEQIWGKGNFNIFQSDIDPNDISQGQLGHCYFLSTLASLAEWPHRIRKIFEVDQVNDQGCYAVKICDTGIWQTIILDDFVPCNPHTRKPIFSKCNDGELWVMLLEKAWAKIYGSYERIEAGLTRECLHDLSGAPTQYFILDDGNTSRHEEIWQAIAEGEQKQFIMTCGSGDYYDGADIMSEIGLVASHAYSLISAIETKDKYGQPVRLVKLRNPWGKGEWQGDWSDHSSTWTDDLKKELGWTDADDGIFFMTYNDMLKYYSDLQICNVHDDYKYSALKATCDSRHAVYFKLTVKTSGHYYITANQESKRKYPEKENYKYSETTLVIGKKVAGGYEYVEGYQRADKEVWTDGELTPGEYIVFAKVAWNNKQSKDFTLSAYGMDEVDIEIVAKSYCSDFIEKVYISKGRQSKKLEDYSYCGVKNCFRAVELTDDGFGFLYYRNESGKTLEEEIYFKAFEGLKLRKPHKGNNYKISVPAGEEGIVITKVLPNAQRIRQAFTQRVKFH